jgi:two-component system response regulator DevR
MEKIHVLLLENDLFWQEFLTTELRRESDITLTHAAVTKETATEVAESLVPDIILVDVHLSPNKYDCLEMAEDILRATKNKSKIIILTSIVEQEVILRAFQLGAINCLTRSSSQDIVTAIREAFYNTSSIHCDVAEIIRNELRLMLLTRSEREVYDLYQKGLSKTQISEQMHKSFNTIKTQIKSIKTKLLI